MKKNTMEKGRDPETAMKPQAEGNPGERMSGGETGDAEEYCRMRALIGSEPDVYDVLGLSWVHHEQRWLYVIRTPFRTWPKFAVGYTDRENAGPEVIFACGSEVSARQCFEEHNCGDHG